MAHPADRTPRLVTRRELSARRRTGVWLHSYTDPYATVVAAGGEINEGTADQMLGPAGGLIPTAAALIVDLRDVDFLGAAGLRALVTIGQRCAEADRPWALITSDAVNLQLRLTDDLHDLPVAKSMTQARRLTSWPVSGAHDPRPARQSNRDAG